MFFKTCDARRGGSLGNVEASTTRKPRSRLSCLIMEVPGGYKERETTTKRTKTIKKIQREKEKKKISLFKIAEGREEVLSMSFSQPKCRRLPVTLGYVCIYNKSFVKKEEKPLNLFFTFLFIRQYMGNQSPFLSPDLGACEVCMRREAPEQHQKSNQKKYIYMLVLCMYSVQQSTHSMEYKKNKIRGKKKSGSAVSFSTPQTMVRRTCFKIVLKFKKSPIFHQFFFFSCQSLLHEVSRVFQYSSWYFVVFQSSFSFDRIGLFWC